MESIDINVCYGSGSCCPCSRSVDILEFLVMGRYPLSRVHAMPVKCSLLEESGMKVDYKRVIDRRVPG